MSYATQQDLIDRFGEGQLIELTDPAQVVIDAGKVATALADAGSTIDSYLSGRYALPLSVVPRVLVRVACDLARFELFRGDGKYPTDEVTEARDDAVKWLGHVSRGMAHLDNDAAGQAVPVAGGAAGSSEATVFDRPTLDGYLNGGKP